MKAAHDQRTSGCRALSIRLFALLADGLLSGCAVFNRDNRRILNTLDGAIHPDSTGSKIVLAPVMVPVGTAALMTDMVILHPIRVIPDAADDVYEFYWKPRGLADSDAACVTKRLRGSCMAGF